MVHAASAALAEIKTQENSEDDCTIQATNLLNKANRLGLMQQNDDDHEGS